MEHVRYDPFLLSESETKPSPDNLFPDQTHPFAFELHTAIARYEAVVDEAASIATACMKNLNLLLPTTYAIAEVILSSKRISAIITAQYNIIYVKRYLASLDSTYQSFSDKYFSFLDHIDQPTGTIFAYEPHSMPFSFEYDAAIPIEAFSTRLIRKRKEKMGKRKKRLSTPFLHDFIQWKIFGSTFVPR